MKKRNLIVALSGMGALAVAVGAVGTAAWYVADSNVNVNKSATETGNLVVGSSTATVSNNFVIKPSAITASTTLAYTDTSGHTKVSVYNGDTYDAIQGDTAADRVATFVLKAKIEYTGSLTDKASVQNLWESTVATVSLTLACTAVTDDKVAGTPSINDIRFTTGASSYAGGGQNSYAQGADQFTFGDFAENKSVTNEVTIGTVYVALTGSDALVVDATHKPVYTLTVSCNYTNVVNP